MDADEKLAAKRGDWPVRVRTLATQESARMGGTAEERLQALLTLTEQAWRLSAKALPQYAREDAPIRIIRMRPESEEEGL